MKILLKYFCFISLTILLSKDAFTQVSINGPQCVVAGTVYQYTIKANWDSSSTMQICIKSGIIANSAENYNCTTPGGAPLGTVLVIWNNSASAAGAISLTSSKGNAGLKVNFAGLLIPGSIDSMSKTQMIAADSIPSAIKCSGDKGGSCNPSYRDQWQQSPDMVSWTDIAGANSQNLLFNSPPVQATFYRRKVKEITSGTIGYSDVAVVNLQIAGTTMEAKRLKDINQMVATLEQKKQFQLTLKSITP